MISNTSILIKKIKFYFNKKKNNANDPNYHLITYDTSNGFLKLLKLQKKKIQLLKIFFIYLKNFLAASRIVNFNIIKGNIQNNFDNIIVTWGWNKDFSKNGNYSDKYFNKNSKSQKKTLWFVIILDNKVPFKIPKNVVLLINTNPAFVNFKNLFQQIINQIFLFLKNKKFKHFSYSEELANLIWSEIKQIVNFTNLKKIIVPYEAQLFQNYLFHNVHKSYKGIKTIGYVHATQAFPIHLFKRDGAPKILYTHGKDQQFHLLKFLGWKKNEVKLIPSIKIRKKNKKKFQNIIFFPYFINDFNFYINNLEYLFDKEYKNFSANLSVKIHPLREKKKSFIYLKKKIELIIKNKNFSKKLNYCNPIILGTSSVVLEALENNLKPFHITENKTLESYSNGFWPSIKSRVIEKEKIFQYKLIKKNNCIDIDSKQENIF